MEKYTFRDNFAKAINFFVSFCVGLGIIVILGLHAYVSFFPVLFLFDFCLLIGYPLFLRFVLKKRWFDCHTTKILTLKYIIIPWAIMESLVMLYYPKETVYILQIIFFNTFHR